MPKVLVDGTALSDQYKTRGIGTYTRNVLSRLVRDSHFEWHIIGFEDARSICTDAAFYSLGGVVPSTPRNLIYFRKKMRPIIQDVKPDAYFAPHFERGLPIGICPVVVVIHDLYPYVYNAYSAKNPLINFLKGLFYRYNLSNASKADSIITNSEYTKRQLQKIHFEPEKIHAIHLGPGLDFPLERDVPAETRNHVRQKYSLSDQFVMYYGGLEKNKNVDLLLRSVARLPGRVKLLVSDKTLFFRNGDIVAESAAAQRVKDVISDLNMSGRVILPRFIETEDMQAVFDQAMCFVHLSRYEGFGFAVVEAMKAGCPVIAADASCYPEIVGDAAVLVDPDTIDAVSAAIQKMCNDKQYRGKYAEKGERHARNYSWEETAEKTSNVLKKIIKTRQ